VIKSKNIIIGPAFPLRGGIANFNNSLCKAFVKEGIDSKIFSFSLQYPSFLFPGKTQYESGDPPKEIKIETIINSINFFNWIKIALKIRREKPNYVIIRYWLPFMAPCLGTIARIIKWNTSIKVLSITDNVIPHEKRIGDSFLTSYFVKSCDAFITLSHSVLEDLSRFTKNTNKKFIPHPIYDNFGEIINKEKAQIKLGLKKSEKYLLFFGFIRKYKGLDILLNALSDKRLKDVKLIVAGEFYDDINFYKDLILKLKISNQVIFKDEFIDSKDVKFYFSASDMVVQTYRSATQSGVTQIGYHFNKPMLVTNVGGLSEIIPHKKVGYVTSIDPKEIADSIFDFYSNKREKEFSLNSKIEKNKFTWKSLVSTIEEMI
tara:strand:+ start:1121 stop:2245 length:1125 start_codon:yes stop_codon:yes gene_type:complete